MKRGNIAFETDVCGMNLTVAPGGGYLLLAFIESNRQSQSIYFESKDEIREYVKMLMLINSELDDLKDN